MKNIGKVPKSGQKPKEKGGRNWEKKEKGVKKGPKVTGKRSKKGQKVGFSRVFGGSGGSVVEKSRTKKGGVEKRRKLLPILSRKSAKSGVSPPPHGVLGQKVPKVGFSVGFGGGYPPS